MLLIGPYTRVFATRIGSPSAPVQLANIFFLISVTHSNGGLTHNDRIGSTICSHIGIVVAEFNGNLLRCTLVLTNNATNHVVLRIHKAVAIVDRRNDRSFVRITCNTADIAIFARSVHRDNAQAVNNLATRQGTDNATDTLSLSFGIDNTRRIATRNRTAINPTHYGAHTNLVVLTGTAFVASVRIGTQMNIFQHDVLDNTRRTQDANEPDILFIRTVFHP